MSWRMRALIIAAAGIAAIAATVSAADAAPSSQDTQFLQQAHQANLAEISAGRLAQQRGDSPVVKSIGATLVKDHTTLDSSLQRTADALGVALPAEPTTDQQVTAAQLEQQSGPGFDNVLVTSEIEGHEMSMAAVQTEIAHGSDPQVVDVARTAAPVVARHLQLLRAAAAQLGIAVSPSPSPSASGVPTPHSS